MKKLLVLIFSVTISLFFSTCCTIERHRVVSNFLDENMDYLAGYDSATTFKAWMPSDAVVAAIKFYKKKFSKSVLKPEKEFKVQLLNDSVWLVESPMNYKRLTHEKVEMCGLSKTGILLISRKNASVLYFTLYTPSGIKETHAHAKTYFNSSPKSSK